MKKIVSLISAMAITAATLGALAANAGYYQPNDPFYEYDGEEKEFLPLTFKEYLEMDDETFMKYVEGMSWRDFSARGAALSGFGDDTINDEEKFEAYSWHTNGMRRQSLFLAIDDKVSFSIRPRHNDDPLNSELTAADFGFCDDWEVETRDAPRLSEWTFTDLEGNTTITYNYNGDFHDYVIHCPADVYRDFETYIRLEAAVAFGPPKSVLEKTNADFMNLYQDFAAISANNPVVHGDANADGVVTVADATAIMQAIGNPDKYGLTGYGKVCADCCDFGDGVSPLDALAVLEYEAKVLDKLPKVTK